jgi:hypothetical protein
MFRLNTTYETTIVFTDAEPDDMVALAILKTNRKIDLIVVSEGSMLQAKAARVQALYPDIPVECGWTSDKPFVESTVPTCTYATYDTADVTFDNCLLIALSPMTGLVNLHPIVYSQATLWAYGSFNFRSTMATLGLDSAAMVSFLSSFKETYIYESFHVTGEQNNLNPDVFAMDLIHDIPGMRAIMIEWDTALLAIMKANTHGNADRMARRQKAIDQISASMGNQLVLADAGLSVTSMKNDYDRSVITFDPKTFYTQVAPCSDGTSTIFMCRKLGFEEIICRLRRVLVICWHLAKGAEERAKPYTIVKSMSCEPRDVHSEDGAIQRRTK